MKNIIITGGGLTNKGAQAMTLITVDALRKRFPEHMIYLYSETDRQRSDAEKSIYRFSFTGWYPMKFARCQHNHLLRAVTWLKNHAELREAETLYKNTDFILDISGYALGSGWSNKICSDYLDILEFAQSFGIPVYLMPQSFGPFDFRAERKELDERIRRLLPNVKMIFAREQEGYDALVDTYHLTNVQMAHDVVLSSREIDLSNVFHKIPDMNIPEIFSNSVAVIPNTMNTNVIGVDSVNCLYCDMIEELLKCGRTVYVLAHSGMDAGFCRSLKEIYADNNSVILLDQDFSCLEFNELVKKFDYCVASRFHSIVHAYKNGIPCIAIGWATKYADLLKVFGQESYLFDVREAIDRNSITKAIADMELCYRDESKKIISSLANIQKQNVFDILTGLETK